MPTKITRVGSTKAVVYTHICEICGKHACVGVDVKFKSAINAFVKNGVEAALLLMGKWYCGDCAKNK